MKPHKHAEVIRAWADGAIIQMKCGDEWRDWEKEESPIWRKEFEYRIKPAEPEKIYPETLLTGPQLAAIFEDSSDTVHRARPMRAVANAALRHACDNGQIVPREEFDRAVGDRKKRDLDVANAVDEAWRTKVLRFLPQVDHMSIAGMVNLPLVLDRIKQ